MMWFSYMGTRYRGVQRQSKRGSEEEIRDRSVATPLEFAFNSVEPKPVDNVIVMCSSRTDAGVHGLGSSAHFHMTHPDTGQLHEPQSIVSPTVPVFNYIVIHH